MKTGETKENFKKLSIRILRKTCQQTASIKQQQAVITKEKKKANEKIRVFVPYDSQYRNTVDGMNDKMDRAHTGDPEGKDGKRQRI